MEKTRTTEYRRIVAEHPGYMNAIEQLGHVIRQDGPIDDKTANLIQLAGAVAVHSPGAIQSHVRRAADAGASRREIHQAIMLLTSFLGLPSVIAALSSADEVLEQ